jgi:hypothetical protein
MLRLLRAFALGAIGLGASTIAAGATLRARPASAVPSSNSLQGATATHPSGSLRLTQCVRYPEEN